MRLLNIFRATPEKWILTVVLWAGFWLTVVIMEILIQEVHQWLHPELRQSLPPSLSFDEEITHLFEMHRQALAQSMHTLLPIKLLVSGFVSYLGACLVTYLCDKTGQVTELTTTRSEP